MPINFLQETFRPRLNASISVPSAVHGYSLAVEYMYNWFLSTFDKYHKKDFFKTKYINGKHVFDDYRKMDNTDKLKREKPAMSITPQVQFDNNSENIDLNYGNLDLYIRRSNYNKAFFKDIDNNLYLALGMQSLVVNFAFRVKVSTRAEQLDLVNFMNLAFRVGLTQGEDRDLDFHIPRTIMLTIAHDNGFEITKDIKYNDIIKDPIGFLQYLNKHSVLPILYKLRTVNGNSEFFLRMPRNYIHIAIPDKLSPDDGQRDGMLDNDFNIDMNCILTLPVPQFYVYYSKESQEIYTPTIEPGSENFAGIYSFKLADYPDKNDKGWAQYLTTEYITDELESEIDISTPLEHHEIRQVIDYTTKSFISSNIFLDIKLYNGGNLIPTHMDWEKLKLILDKEIHGICNIIIYVDLEYVNEQLIVINNLNDSRLN